MSKSGRKKKQTPPAPVNSRFGVTCVAILALLATLALWRTLSQPSTYFLRSENSAEWIRYDEPANLIRTAEPLTAWFRTRLNIGDTALAAPVVLHVRAFRHATVYVDGKQIFSTPDDLTLWKNTYDVDVSNLLTKGDHVVAVSASNYLAAPCLLAYCDELALATNDSWEASLDGSTWTKARGASKPQRPEVATEFTRADRAFFSTSPVFIVVFLVAVGGYFGFRRSRFFNAITPARVRWGLFAAIAVLFINNLFHLAPDIGFDIKGHFDYVAYIATHWSLPLPSDGWIMYHSPFFYVMSAPIFAIGQHFLSFEQLMGALRIIPMICGALQIELSFRLLRLFYPERPDLQMAGMTFSAFVPVNLYISQYAGNEPLCALFCGIVLLFAFEAVQRPQQALSRGRLSVTGVLFGLALLTKVSACIIGPPVALMYVHAVLRAEAPTSDRFRSVARTLGYLFGVALIVSGWFFVRNWVAFGKPFLGGWEPERGFVWWQEPGYRTFQQFFSFGESLRYPVYSAVWSFWDGLYSTFWMDGALSGLVNASEAPPWNYTWQLAGIWWALLPTAAILLGIARACLAPHTSLRTGHAFAVMVVAAYVAATLYISLKMPFYSPIKASYSLAALPCCALLFVSGLELATRKTKLRPVVYGLLACWAFAAYVGFFSIG